MTEAVRKGAASRTAAGVLACLALVAVAMDAVGGGAQERTAATLCIAAAAAGLLLALRGFDRIAGALASLVVLAGLAGLASQFLGAAGPPRPAPLLLPSPLGFATLLLGTAGLALAWPHPNTLAREVTRACAATALLFMAVTSGAQDWRTAPSPSLGGEGPASWHLVALTGLALGHWLATRRWRAPASQAIDRYAAWIPVVLAAFVVWGAEALVARERLGQARNAAMARDTIVEDIAFRLKVRGDALQRLAERWSTPATPLREAWEADAGGYLRDFEALQAVIFAEPDLIVRWRVARVSSPDLVGESIAADDGRLQSFEAARASGRVRLTPVVRLRSGGDGLVFVAPVQSGRTFHGYITASMRLDDLLALARTPALRHFSVRVRDARGWVALEAPDAPQRASLVQHAALDALGQPWTVEVWPREAYLRQTRSRLPETVFLLGGLAVALVSAALVQARRSVQHSEAAEGLADRLKATLEGITDAFFTLDRDWRFTYVNPEAERLLERDRQSLVGRSIWSEFPEADGSEFQAHYRRAMEEGETVAFEAHYAPLDRWFNVRAYPAPDGVAVYFQDATQAVRQREALQQRDRELMALAEALPQMVWMARPDGTGTYFNERWMDYTGQGASEVISTGWISCVHPDDLPAARAVWQHSLEEEAPFTLETRLRRRDGAYRWMLVRAVPYLGSPGQPVKWLGSCTDIDDLKRSAQALHVSEERFRLLSAASNDAIWDCELASGAMWYSESFGALFGAEAAMPATLEGWSARIHPAERATALVELHDAMAEGRDVWHAQFRFRRADGEWAHVSSRGYVIRDADGQAKRLLCGMSDITQQVRLEEQLRQSQRLESVGQLTGGVAHDFNNLLTVILGNAEVLADALQSDRQLHALAGMIVGAAERGADLTQRLLAFSRKQALSPRPVDLHERLAELRTLLSRTLGEHIAFSMAVEPGTANAMVDPAQLDNALLNLCLNARDAMPGGGRLDVVARNRQLTEEDRAKDPDVPPGHYVEIAVSDTGRGIAPEELPRVFEPFFTTKEPGKGTGLGLAMVYGFIKQSGGQVDIRSEPGRGTTVTIALPRAPDGATGRAPQPPAQLPTGRARVLLVEDDPLVRDYAALQLRSLGYEVFEVPGPVAALQFLQGPTAVDLMFTDVVMPGGTGPELAEKARELRPDLRVLFTSGYADDAVIHRYGLSAGVNLLPKPYSREKLAHGVAAALQPDAHLA